MRFSVADNTDTKSLSSRMRRKRLSIFLAMISTCPKPRVSVLDVGGTEAFWSGVWSPECERLDISLLNLDTPTMAGATQFCQLAGDGRDLHCFKDGSFDFCFSNSVIEHVGGLADQMRMAREVARVSRGYFVQTPYRYFPIEAHYQFPLWTCLPISFRAYLHHNYDLGWVCKNPDWLGARADVEGGRLLRLREYRAMFPDAQIKLETIGPLVKSLIAVKEWGA